MRINFKPVMHRTRGPPLGTKGNESANEWMDGWMDGWMDERMNEWMAD